jgi:hypothetical protein
LVALRRTTVFADEDDLAVIKAAAARRGVAEAELIRDAIHLAALANRVWAEPVFGQTHTPRRGRRSARTGDVLDHAWADKAAAYEQSKNRHR